MHQTHVRSGLEQYLGGVRKTVSALSMFLTSFYKAQLASLVKSMDARRIAKSRNLQTSTILTQSQYTAESSSSRPDRHATVL